jgi:hypothetical protein
MFVTDELAEKALKRLADTDNLAAELHLKAERAKFKADAIHAAIFLRTEGNVAERKAVADTHEDYAREMTEYFDTLQAYEALKNERGRKVIVIDCWRSLNSARNKGLL